MSFIIESQNADYERISEFAEDLTEKIMEDDNLIYGHDVEIVGVSVEEIIDENFDEYEQLELEED
jgi:hypothetical protein